MNDENPSAPSENRLSEPGMSLTPQGRSPDVSGTTFLVCYDVADDKRLRRALKTCRNFGGRLQYSVFECDLNPSEKIELEEALSKIINHDEDQVLLVALGPAEERGDRAITSLGLPYTRSWTHRATWFEILVIFDN